MSPSLWLSQIESHARITLFGGGGKYTLQEGVGIQVNDRNRNKGFLKESATYDAQYTVYSQGASVVKLSPVRS